jgi:DNA-binding response OmpR family regulator
VRVLVIGGHPEEAAREPDSAATVLADLGCRVTTARFDLGDLDDAGIEKSPPALVVIDGGDQLERAVGSRKALDRHEVLAEVPTLLVVTVARLPALDFSLGFDDFVLRPLVPAELYARLRQLDWKSATFGSEDLIKIGELVIDVAGYEVFWSGRSLTFTHQEFELLRFLAQNRGRVFSRDQLLTRVWGYQYAGGSRTVDIHVRRVRAKLGAVAGGLITTVRNVGYKMRGSPDDD